jgi:hypothetical protein
MKSKKSSSRITGSSDILHNKYVLYASFFFAIVTAAGYLLRNNLEAICIFVIIGFLTTYFSKNMIVVLLVTTIATNFIVIMRNKNRSTIEGMETNDNNGSNTNGATTPTENEKKKKNATAATAPAPLQKPVGSEPSQAAPDAEVSMDKITSANSSTKTNKNLSEGLSNLSPAPVGSEGNSMLDLQKGMAKGYGAQKEQAYQALASLGGTGAAGSASNLSAETLSQQSEMINNLKSIQPILDTAEKFLDKFEHSSISKVFSNMGNIPGMSLLTGGLGKTASPTVPVGAQA